MKCLSSTVNPVDARASDVHFTLPLAKNISTRNQYASPAEGNAKPAGPLSDSDEILCCCEIPIGPVC